MIDPPAIRPACAEDLPAIYALMAAFDMFGEFSAEDCYVAEAPHGLAGFARLETVDACTYLRPIVVAHDSQGQGIGRSLLEYVLRLAPGLAVIARGSALGFYTRSGFEPIDWERVPQVYREECAACADLKICSPVPMQHL